MNDLDDILGDRLTLRLLSPSALAATANGDLAEAARLTALNLPPEWSEVASLARRRLDQIEADPQYLPWSIRAIVLRETKDVVGFVNFHAAPGSDDLKERTPNAVELGYEIIPHHRGQGYASETVRLLIDWAKARGVDGFVFSISPGNDASLAIVRRLGGVKVGSHIDPEDGPEDVYLLTP